MGFVVTTSKMAASSSKKGEEAENKNKTGIIVTADNNVDAPVNIHVISELWEDIYDLVSPQKVH